MLLAGCAARHIKARGEVVIPIDCIIEIKATDKTVCHGPDGQHIKCENVALTRYGGCEVPRRK